MFSPTCRLTVYLPYDPIVTLDSLFRRSKVALPHWLQECIQVTDQDHCPERDENVMDFPRRPVEPVRNDGQSAINLVYQAAEVVGNLQEHARQTEIRAQTLCRSAL